MTTTSATPPAGAAKMTMAQVEQEYRGLIHAGLDRSGLDPEGYARSAPLKIARTVAEMGQEVEVQAAQAMGHPRLGSGMHMAVNPDLITQGAKHAQLEVKGRTKDTYGVVVGIHEAGHINASTRAPALGDALIGVQNLQRTSETGRLTPELRDAMALQEHIADMHSLLATGAIPDRKAFFQAMDVQVPNDYRLMEHILDRLPQEQHGYALTVPLNWAGETLKIAMGTEATATVWKGAMERLGGDTRIESFARAMEETAVASFTKPEDVANVGMVRKMLDTIGLDAAARARAPFRAYDADAELSKLLAAQGGGGGGSPFGEGAGGLDDLLRGDAFKDLFGKGGPGGLEELLGKGGGGGIDDLMRGMSHLRA